MLLAENKSDTAPAIPSAARPAFEARKSAPRAATESVEVAAATESVTESSPEDTLMLRNPAPAIEKAKPALPGPQVIGQQNIGEQNNEAPSGVAAARLQNRNAMAGAKLAASSNPTLVGQSAGNSVTWTIKAGVLVRSLDRGQSWQNALRTDHPLLCYAGHDSDIWTGGQAGTLFHSSDNGLTWTQLQPSIKTYALTSDITRIEIQDNLRGPAKIIVSTRNNETWTSTDGGKTWDKK